MGWYRLYFLSQQGDIRNVDEFSVKTDEHALVLADSLHDAVSDIYAGYELWHDSRRLFRCPNRESTRPFVPQQTITTEMQASLLKREQILHESASAFARSQKLLERIREVEAVVRPDKRSYSNKRRAALNRTV
jgi:hypothetical protein